MTHESPYAEPEPGAGKPVAASAGEPVAALEHVGVAYGPRWALRDVTASFPRGAVGLLGPNGAGKSTLLKALLGLIPPRQGHLRLLGVDVASAPVAVRARIGYMPENDAYVPGMNAVTFVAYCGELCGLSPADAVQRAHEVLYYTGLDEVRYRNVETYSTGLRQRIKLAQALVHDPELLFLDEPTNGMDPKGRLEMLDLVRDLAHDKGISVVLSSHVLPDVEYVCPHVIVIDKGQIAAQGPIADLKGPTGRVYELRVKGDDRAFREALRQAGIEIHDTEDDRLRVFVPESQSWRDLFTLAVAHQVQVRHLRLSVPTLEDVFARAVGED